MKQKSSQVRSISLSSNQIRASILLMTHWGTLLWMLHSMCSVECFLLPNKFLMRWLLLTKVSRPSSRLWDNKVLTHNNIIRMLQGPAHLQESFIKIDLQIIITFHFLPFLKCFDKDLDIWIVDRYISLIDYLPVSHISIFRALTVIFFSND